MRQNCSKYKQNKTKIDLRICLLFTNYSQHTVSLDIDPVHSFLFKYFLYAGRNIIIKVHFETAFQV